MNARELINYLTHRSVQLRIVDGVLKCKAPHGVMTDAILECLRENKQEVIALLSEHPGRPRIERRSADTTVLASFAQQRLWFLDQFEPGNASYNIPAAVRLTGRLDVTAFGSSINDIVARHEALRTTFAMAGGVPVQVIAPARALALPIEDLTHLPQGEREARAASLADEEAQTPFDLAAGPLIRVRLLRMSQSEHIVFLTMHHIVSDGWSMGILVRELATLYAAHVQQLPSQLPDLPIQYPDFAHWQRQWLTGGVLDTQLGFWKDKLAGAPALLALATDRPRPAVLTHRGATLGFAVPPATTAGLYEIGRQRQASLFMTLAAAFNVLLSRHSGQDDICIGTPIANRDRVETEGLIGFFVNTLVLRTHTGGNPSFADLLAQVRDTALAAYAHQDVPFEQLVEALRPQRQLSHAPLFQVMLVLQSAPMGRLALPGLTLEPVTAELTTAKFDLTLNLSEAAGRLLASFEYNTDLFDAATIERMAGHFTRLLDAIAADPACRIADLPMLGEAEHKQTLLDWNETTVAYPVRTIDQLFEEQAARVPQRVATVFEDNACTFGELNARANQLAHHLRSRGVGPDVLVGICVERSPEMVVGLLAILKAGGAYLPLDPAHPAERLALVLAEARPALLLTQERLMATLPPTDIELFRLDTQWDALADRPSTNPVHVTQPGNLAYVIYTSGSTGRPKGVAIVHHGLNNYLRWSAGAYPMAFEQGSVVQLPLVFDATVTCLFTPLIAGHSVRLLPPLANHELFDFIKSEQQISLLKITPAHIDLLCPSLEGAPHIAKVGVTVIGGEALSAAQANAWLHHFPDTVIVNEYGPTETVVGCSIYETTVMSSAPVLPIGRPIANTELYILDAHGNPVAVGVAGELHIAGHGLARGYLNRPDLTADKFIPNPFATQPGARMYRSGDLARRLADGSIEYLGRIDDQVKIRGFRIELGEIEAALAARPGVRETVVLARQDSPGDKRLVAYVVAQGGADIDPVALRKALLQSLPEYMVPAHVVLLERLPLTPNGKVDRKALPAPDMARSETGYVAPRTPTETLLADIWAGILGLDRVGIHDNFFDLGGHSLLATRVISTLRTDTGAELPLRVLFEAPTVAELAQRVDRAPRQSAGPAIAPVSRDTALPLSFAQQRLWFLDQFEPGSASYNIPAPVRLVGDLDVSALTRVLNEIVRRHDALRTTFAMHDGAPVQVIAPALDLALPVTDLSALPHGERDARAEWLAQDEAQTPFDLAAGPLIRARLLRLEAHDHIVLFTVHHIVSDGWSMGVLVREVAALYGAYVQGLPSPLPELPVQYADFAHWQRQWLRGDVLQQQLDYWTGQLADAPTLLALPTDRPRPAVQTYNGAQHAFTIDATTTAGLNDIGKQAHGTLFMTLAAAFNVLLARYSGQDDICIGTPIANRNRAETEALIGFFVNTLVLRTGTGGNPVFTDLLAQVRATALGAYAHQDLPFEQLVEALRPERHLGHAPLFQVMLVLQNAPMGALDLPGLTLEPVNSAGAGAKFDLTLSITEGEDRLHASFAYNVDLFEASTIERMAGHFTRLLDAIVLDPACRIADLPMLGSEERTQLLAGWNDTAAGYPRGQTIGRLFEVQAARTPEAVAVVFESVELTYAELDARANQLAHHLRSLGIGPDVLVGLCVERSIEMIVGLFAILKAGGAYLPLDPAYPEDRLTYVLADARPALLLTQQHLLARFPAGAVPGFCLDTQWPLLAGLPVSSPAAAASCSNLAYVIYTSGSTGKPKGVGIAHGSAINLITALAHQVYGGAGRLPGMRIGLNASLSFDASVKQLLLVLYGVSLFLIPERIRADVDLLSCAIGEWKLDGLDCTPAQLSMLLQAHPSRALPRHLLIGGEAIDQSLWDTLRQHTESAPYNVYGPTEATVDTLVCGIHAAENIPVLGKPIANVQVYLLDAHLNPVPVGVPGELYIAGHGLARGYLNRPGQTAEKFLPNPFAADPGERMYRSGDLARRLPDGSIAYLGRLDDQVKIRGFRIELGEIEAALEAQSGVHETVVLAREDVPGDRRLVAYVVPHDAAGAADPARLRAALSKSLPHYMVPAHFVMLDRMPLTPRGKIDRRALPAPDMSRHEAGFVAPRSATESLLADIIAAVLGLDQVGIDDNFFALGGHSLLATQVISRLRATFQTELPLRALFEAPTVAGLAHRLDLARHAQNRHVAPPITRVARGAALPLSFAQQRLWFLDQFEPGNASYNMPAAVRMRGQLDVDALGRALNEIVRRHEALRTSFTMRDGAPAQLISPALELALQVTDLSGLPHGEREARARWLAEDEARTPFDLAGGRLIRASLLRLDALEHIALFTMHHIVSDGWSMGILVRELAALYGAYVQDQPSPLPELAIQYADFAHWQRQWLAGDVLATEIGYWTEQLAGAPALLALPTDRPRPPVQTHVGAALPFAVDAAATAGLHALSRQSGTTLFMTLAAAFNVLLARYSGQDDICIGTPIANRNRAETEALIGFFVNTLVLRTRLGNNPAFADLLAQVRAVALGAYAHQDLPFEQLVEAVNPERHLSHAPLFQVMLVLQNTPSANARMPGLALEPIETGGAVAKFDLSLCVSEEAGQLSCAFEYNTDLFDASTIARMADHFTRLLHAIVQDPACRIADLPMLGTGERSQLLVGWNDTARDYPRTQAVHQLFEAQVEQVPEALALVYEGAELTYAELNARANRLAHHLRTLGVGPDVLVGVCVERSPEMIVGLLAILKAGGAWLPLDPAYPKDRLAFMLADARPLLVLTRQHLRDALPGCGAIFCLDSEADALAHYATANPVNLAAPSNLAYVIYTSGSTGKPKGTLLQHGGLCNRVSPQSNAFAIAPSQRVLQFASLNFDASTWEIFLALSCGATLCMVPPEGLMPGGPLERTLQQLAINFTLLPPVVLNAMPDIALPDLDTLVVGGEACPRELVERWGHGRVFFNAYGPTEATICASVHRCHRHDRGLPPIGRPVANTQVYLLDGYLNPVPAGVAGELYIAGDGLARGYLNRPGLTAEKFIPNPFSPVPGARMYRSGDLARYRTDGEIEYLGRIDSQVKIRGFRIELGEVETALAALPGVRDTVVLAREDIPGDKRLVAYVLPHDGHAQADPELLRDTLVQRLPAHMVPSQVIVLDRMPLTPGGKVDRAALPQPQTARSDAGYVAPRTPTEAALARIWARVLGLDQVGIHDNFFALGGHSLLSAKLLRAMQDELAVTFPLATVFRAPTVATLATIISAGQAAPSLLVPLQSEGSGPPLFCIHPVGGEVFFYQELASSLGRDFPVYGVQSPEIAGLPDRYDSMKAMAIAYCEAIRAVQPAGPYRLLGWSTGGLIALAIASTFEAQGCEVDYVGLLDSTPLADERGRTEEQLAAMAAMATLAAMRGARFTGEEQARMHTALATNGLSIADMLDHDQEASARPYLEDWTGAAIGTDMFARLRLQFAHARHLLSLLGDYRPPEVQAFLHVLRARQSGTPVSPDGAGLDTTGSAIRRRIVTVEGDHYSMLKLPHVQQLSRSIGELIATCAEI